MRQTLPALLLLACLCGVGTSAPPVPPRLHPNEVSGPRDDPGPGVVVDYRTGEVTRSDAVGQKLWTVELGGNLLGRHREPHVLHDKERIYFSVNDGISALDVKTGKVVWQFKGPNDRLHLSGGLLLATQCHNGEEILKHGRWLVARDVVNGEEKFKVALPAENFDPWAIREVAGLFLLQDLPGFSNPPAAFLIDRKGKICHQLGRAVLDARLVGEDRVFLTTHNVIRMTPAGKEVWSIPFNNPDAISSGSLVELPGGGMVCHRFGPISDSGVEVMRFDPSAGKKVWVASCPPLGVTHSKYHHQATAAVDGDRLHVTSRGSSGSFVEVLDLKTGKRIERSPRKPGE